MMLSIRALLFLVLFAAKSILADEDPFVVLMVADSWVDAKSLTEVEALGDAARYGTLVASPHPGMRRVALLSGEDALLSGSWGDRAANLRVGGGAFRQFVERGAKIGFRGAWGLGCNSPWTPGDCGFEVLEGSHAGRTKSAVTSRYLEWDGKKLGDWVKESNLSTKLIYHSLDWKNGEPEDIVSELESYLKLEPRPKIVLVGGGATPPLAVIGSSEDENLPQSIPGVSRLIESFLFPGEPSRLRSNQLERGTRHFGQWSGLLLDPKQRRNGLVTFDKDWVLLGSNRLFKREDYGRPDAKNLFREEIEQGVELLQIQEAWWQAVEPGLKEAKRYVVKPSGVTYLSLEDWGRSEKRPTSTGWPEDGAIEMTELKEVLSQFRSPGKDRLNDFSGVWPLQFEEDGSYELVLQFLPDEMLDLKIAECEPGQLTILTGKSRTRMQVLKGATRFTIRMDIEKGPVDLEAVISNQIGDSDTLLGVFFAKISRLGEMKGERVPLAPK